MFRHDELSTFMRDRLVSRMAQLKSELERSPFRRLVVEKIVSELKAELSTSRPEVAEEIKRLHERIASIFDRYAVSDSDQQYPEYLIDLIRSSADSELRWAALSRLYPKFHKYFKSVESNIVNIIYGESDDDLVCLAMGAIRDEYAGSQDPVIMNMMASIVMNPLLSNRKRLVAYGGLRYVFNSPNLLPELEKEDIGEVDLEKVALFRID